MLIYSCVFFLLFMHILLCHERFLFRFGADRVMMIIGKGLYDLGHEITIMTNRFDRQVVETFASRIIEVPSDGAEYINLSEFTAEWLKHSWDSLFNSRTLPDVVLSGGWPFFDSTHLFRERCNVLIFMDHGVVPRDGYPEGTKTVLNKAHELKAPLSSSLRDHHIREPLSSRVAKHSRFGGVPVRVISNGADHMDVNVVRRKSRLRRPAENRCCPSRVPPASGEPNGPFV